MGIAGDSILAFLGSSTNPMILAVVPRMSSMVFKQPMIFWSRGPSIPDKFRTEGLIVAQSIGERGYRGKTVTIKVRFRDFKTYTRAKTLPEFTDSEEQIRRAAFECLQRLELKKEVRLLGVRISHLEKFSERSPDDTIPRSPEIM